MEWLLMLLRLLLGQRRPEDSEPQPVAIRPDGTTVPLPPGSTNLFRSNYLRQWLTLITPFVACFCGQVIGECLPGSFGKRAREPARHGGRN